MVDADVVELKDATNLNAEFSKLRQKVFTGMKSVREGPFFLAPPNIRNSIGATGMFFLQRYRAGEIDRKFLLDYRAKLVELQELLRKEVGLD